MNHNIWQGKARRMRGNLKRSWGQVTNNDRQRLEGELDRVLGLVQERYGYTRERAAHEIGHYANRYGRRARATVNQQLDQWRGQPTNAFPWGWVAMGLLGLIVYLSRQWWESEQSNKTPAERQALQESLRRERERDDVDERSWESFPASDPPASW